MFPFGVTDGEAALALQSGLLIAGLLLLVLVVHAKWFDKFSIAQARPLRASDGVKYRVQDHPDPQRAANTLADIDKTLIDLIRWLRSRAEGKTVIKHLPITEARAAAIAKLLQRYNPDAIVENSPFDPANDTSYVVGKGRTLAMCIRSRKGIDGANYVPTIHDMSILRFVAIHELSHMAVDAVDHPPEFWSAFKYLLMEAEAAGLFTSPHYRQFPVEYCGLRVNYSPRWDDNCVPLL
jgi:hypothetical protein